jgi:hypothetical protein
MRRIALGLIGLAFCADVVTAQARWTVDAKPMLDLKGTSDAGGVIFGAAQSATRLRNGTIVVADPSGPAVHFLDATGKVIKSNGRSGQGPGDFRTVTWVSQCGEGGVYAWDWAQSRITTYDQTGAMKTTFTFGGRGGPQTQTSCNQKGMLVATSAMRRVDPPTPQDPAAGYRIMGMAAIPVVMASAGDTVARLPELQFVEMLGGMNGRGGGAIPRPLGTSVTFALSADRAYVGISDSASIGVYTLDGKRVGAVAVGAQSATPTAAQYERAADITLAMVPSQMRAQARTWVLGIPMPAKAPSHSGMVVDPSGLLWVVLSMPGDADTRLRAFGMDGRAVANVTVPVSLTVFEIGTDYILGAREDADGEQRITLYKLNRTGGRP